MTTSGSIDHSLTARQVVTFALRKAKVIDTLNDPAAEEMRDGLLDLNLMLKSWQTDSGPNLWRQTFGSMALVAATASYVLTPRPFRLIEARYRNASGIDLEMIELTRQEYAAISQKTASGTPTQFYLDRQAASSTLYVWPVPASVTTETIQYTYQRVIEDIDAAANDLDIPQEWLETVGYNLAYRLSGSYGSFDKELGVIASGLLADAKDSDRESIVRFTVERY
jgi:hypothetical protein